MLLNTCKNVSATYPASPRPTTTTTCYCYYRLHFTTHVVAICPCELLGSLPHSRSRPWCSSSTRTARAPRLRRLGARPIAGRCRRRPRRSTSAPHAPRRSPRRLLKMIRADPRRRIGIRVLRAAMSGWAVARLRRGTMRGASWWPTR